MSQGEGVNKSSPKRKKERECGKSLIQQPRVNHHPAYIGDKVCKGADLCLDLPLVLPLLNPTLHLMTANQSKER